MDLSEFSRLSKADATIAYSKLVKAVNVTFSGSINPLINKLDYKKINE